MLITPTTSASNRGVAFGGNPINLVRSSKVDLRQAQDVLDLSSKTSKKNSTLNFLKKVVLAGSLSVSGLLGLNSSAQGANSVEQAEKNNTVNVVGSNELDSIRPGAAKKNEQAMHTLEKLKEMNPDNVVSTDFGDYIIFWKKGQSPLVGLSGNLASSFYKELSRTLNAIVTIAEDSVGNQKLVMIKSLAFNPASGQNAFQTITFEDQKITYRDEKGVVRKLPRSSDIKRFYTFIDRGAMKIVLNTETEDVERCIPKDVKEITKDSTKIDEYKDKVSKLPYTNVLKEEHYGITNYAAIYELLDIIPASKNTSGAQIDEEYSEMLKKSSMKYK